MDASVVLTCCAWASMTAAMTGDLGERGPFDALLVQELGRGGDQPLPFPGPLIDGGRLA
jgi:hypothetical protein